VCSVGDDGWFGSYWGKEDCGGIFTGRRSVNNDVGGAGGGAGEAGLELAWDHDSKVCMSFMSVILDPHYTP